MKYPFDASGRAYRYVIGIDLGTTNTAVAYHDLSEDEAGEGRGGVHFFEVPQLVAPAELGRLPGLPSFLYLPGAYDLPPGSTALPWDPGRSYVVGAFARDQGARVPGRLVSSAKSWLSHSGVDRTAAMLPWGAGREVDKVSPVEAGRRYLQHLREAWNARFITDPETERFERQLLILTVPASFDEVARELTVQAAQEAGLEQVILLEEPLAAFYAWVADHEGAWQGRMKAGELILVCDVGGGTTDFSMIGIQDGPQGLELNRLAVGDHLMLGGDNMDNTLGRHLEKELAGGPGKLDAQRWHQLVHACRKAKEQLLGVEEAQAISEVDVTIAGAGGQLIAGTLTGRLSRDEIRDLLVEGFFPEVALTDRPGTVRRAGLTELGLPYVSDPAITRHLAAFWQRFLPYLQEVTGRSSPFPDYVLFNGGVFTPPVLRDRVLNQIVGWFEETAGPGWQPVSLENPHLDRAVAKGAAYYGQVRRGRGTRIGSGSPRGFYVGVEAGAGDEGEDVHTAVCLVPRGAEEGFTTRLATHDFEALTNQPVTLHLYTSTTRTGDVPGQVVQLPAGEVDALPPIRTVLAFGKKGVARRLPIQLAVRLTEIGTLDLWCQSRETDHRWQLQFDVRQEAPSEDEAAEVDEGIDPARVEEALHEIKRTFSEAGAPDAVPPDGLMPRLERILDAPHAAWTIPVLRRMADTLLPLPRAASYHHEAAWFKLLGYCLRPGYGDPVDEWRLNQAWKSYLEGMRFPAKVECRIAWWGFWRRLAGGLPANKQAHLYHEVRPYLQLNVKTKKKSRLYPRRLEPREMTAAWMALASMERLTPDIKVVLGRLLLEKFKKKGPIPAEYWVFGRLGARNPMYGPLDQLTPPDAVADWLNTLFTMYPPQKHSVAYALVHMARYTGDRGRDLPEASRQQVFRWLRKVEDEAYFRNLLTDPAATLTREEEGWFFGDLLPPEGKQLQNPHALATATAFAELASDVGDDEK